MLTEKIVCDFLYFRFFPFKLSFLSSKTPVALLHHPSTKRGQDVQAFKDRGTFITFFYLHESDNSDNGLWRGGRAGSRAEKNKDDD